MERIPAEWVSLIVTCPQRRILREMTEEMRIPLFPQIALPFFLRLLRATFSRYCRNPSATVTVIRTQRPRSSRRDENAAYGATKPTTIVDPQLPRRRATCA